MPNDSHTPHAGTVQEFYIDATADNLKISVLVAIPAADTAPRAIVQIVHGMCEHKERYLPFMQYLNTRGYICIAHDHRGHGKSIRTADD